MDVDPESPEWTIAWSLKQNARTLLGPRADRVPVDLIAKQVIGDLRRSNWRLITIPPELPVLGSPRGDAGSDPQTAARGAASFRGFAVGAASSLALHQ